MRAGSSTNPASSGGMALCWSSCWSPYDGGDDDGHQRLFVAVDELVRLASQSRGSCCSSTIFTPPTTPAWPCFSTSPVRPAAHASYFSGTARSGTDTEALGALRALVGRHGAREIPVGPFADEHAVQLIEATGGDAPAPEVLDRILALSGGTPFYLEEVAKSFGSVLPPTCPIIWPLSWLPRSPRCRMACATH